MARWDKGSRFAMAIHGYFLSSGYFLLRKAFHQLHCASELTFPWQNKNNTLNDISNFINLGDNITYIYLIWRTQKNPSWDIEGLCKQASDTLKMKGMG